jgi:hypothetical membrane protein
LFAFGALYPGYSQYSRAVSALGAFGAPHSLTWNLIGFIVPGLLLAVSGARIALAVDGRRATLFWLLLVSASGFAGSGVFPAEMWNGIPVRQSPWTMAHILMISITGFPWLVAVFVLVFRVKRNPQWRHLTGVALILAVLAVVGFGFRFLVNSIPTLAEADGLTQRIAFAGYFAWFLIAEFLFLGTTPRAKHAIVA